MLARVSFTSLWICCPVLQIFILISVHCIVAQELKSSENINEILDKLILQTHLNETGPTAEIKDLTPIVETQPGNNSNIYYFKTFVTPHISFKSSNETAYATEHSNKTVQSFEVSNEDHHATSEVEPFPGTSSISRKSFTVDNQKHFLPRHSHAVQESQYTELKERAGHGDEHENLLKDLIDKNIVSDFTNNNNKQISITQVGHQNHPLGSLHQYPEIFIDHITYDKGENDKNKIVKKHFTHDPQHAKNIIKEENNEVQTEPPGQKRRYNIPEEEIVTSEYDSPEYVESRNYFPSEMKGFMDAALQKKVMHDVLLKQTTERESRKQNMLLEKILRRLPEKRRMNNNVKTSHPLHHERIAPIEIETQHRTGGNHFRKSYPNVPLVPNNWEIYNRLLGTLVRMCRPDILKPRLVAGFIDRIIPSIDYRPMYYDLYKK